MDCFRPYSEQLIKTLILIQKEHLEGSDDPQRRYILSAWQRLAMVMEKEFAPILPEIMPEFFNMASLQPKISSGTSGEDILDYLTEVENSPEKKTISIESDELEEKNIGIQMLCVFIDELKELYAPYVEKTSELFLSLLKFKYNTSIRSSTADSLPTMLTAIKECEKGLEGALPFAQSYISALFETMKGEEDTTVMQHQVSGIKRCIDIMGEFLDEDQVNQMCNIFFECISKSDHRKNINVAYNEENEQGDDEVDKQNRMFMEEENEIEDDLQLTLSEAFGALFKTHKNKCANLLNTLFNDLLPSYLDESAPFVKQKFGVYIVVDLVEHLGLEILGEKYEDCFQVIARCSKSVNPVIRQAGVYGLGISSNSGGELFAKYSTDALQSLKEAIEMKVGTQDVVEFNHARDNAISALSKIMKFQHE
mmetsp:Transcript_33835/g.33364  ORF Transcript_33835/g.33364 Transcript_33835/m.33364 type:complete len:423 (-) Transcript_33835:378-1646(-)